MRAVHVEEEKVKLRMKTTDAEGKRNQDMIPDFCSLVLPHRLYFGGFPSETALQQLQELGVTYMVDLTTPEEKKILTPYHKKLQTMVYLNFPIEDNQVPMDEEAFRDFLVWTASILDKECLYIHCKGGHGRSGMVAASLLCYLYHWEPSHAIAHVTRAHQTRETLSPRWKHRLCPANKNQRVFIETLFSEKILSPETLETKDPSSVLLALGLHRILCPSSRSIESTLAELRRHHLLHNVHHRLSLHLLPPKIDSPSHLI